MGTVNDRIAGDNRKTYLEDAEAEDQKVKKVVDNITAMWYLLKLSLERSAKK